MNWPVLIGIGIVALIGLVVVSGLDLGDAAPECNPDQIMALHDGVWSCVDLFYYDLINVTKSVDSNNVTLTFRK